MKPERTVFLFPKTNHFKEDRPRVNYENMYGWIDAYCMLFDPENLLLMGDVPIPANGAEKVSSRDFVITSDREATRELCRKFDLNGLAGIFIRPASGGKTFRGYKDRLETPRENLYYPGGSYGLEYDVSEEGLPVPGWKIGEFCALHREQKHLSLRVELFSLFWRLADEMSGKRYMLGAGLLKELLKTALGTVGPDHAGDESFRTDFMAYGLNRFLLWRLAERKKTAVEFPDARILEAAAAWSRGGDPEPILREAFHELRRIRERLSRAEFLFYEAPHFGVYLDGQPFIEVEWPQNLADRMRSFLRDAHEFRWRPSLEGSANCWSYFLEKEPDLKRELVRAWKAGEIDLVNGTYALPFALLSPLGMQYREFQLGTERFTEIFGQPAKTYECQENSFSPQMPDLLNMFGYERVVHVTQNHGVTPLAERIFLWKSPGGTAILAIGCADRKNSRISIQIFYELPDRAAELEGKQVLFNMQDITEIPMRALMIRSMKYGSVWGRFVTAEELSGPASVSHVYGHDDYSLSQSYFYMKPNRDNMLSSYEKIFRLNGAYRCAQLMDPEFRDRDFEQDVCMLESHDVLVAAGERPGEFYLNFVVSAPPFIPRVVINDKVRAVAARCESKIHSWFSGKKECWNLSGARLPFVRKGDEIIPVSAAPWSRIRLPETLPVRRPGKDGGGEACFNLNHGLQCRNYDSRGYEWQLLSRTEETCGTLSLERMILFHEGESVELVMIGTEDRSFFEISLRYAVNGFESRKRGPLAEFLALEFSFTETASIGPVHVFTPNVEQETAQDQVCSPYYLRLPEKNCLFLNQGSFFYQIQRNESKIRWIYHVPLEKVHTRSMAVSFRSDTPLEQARAWAQGPVPGTPSAPEQWPVRDSLSIECRTQNGKWLVSNLSGEAIGTIPPWGVAEI